MLSKTVLIRRIPFSCGGVSYQKNLSFEENRKLWGREENPFGQGYNYILEAHLLGPVEHKTGMIMDTSEVDSLLKGVIAPLNHKNLSTEVQDFQEKPLSCENVANFCFQRLTESLPNSIKLLKLRLYENERIWVDCLNEEI